MKIRLQKDKDPVGYDFEAMINIKASHPYNILSSYYRIIVNAEPFCDNGAIALGTDLTAIVSYDG